jgi:hypothetical protein
VKAIDGYDENRPKQRRRCEDLDEEYFDFKQFLIDFTGFLIRHYSDKNRQEIASIIKDATGLAQSTILNTLAGYTMGLKAVCRLAAFADMSIDKYVKEL